MTGLRRRLNRLEQACGVDSSGYPRQSPRWLEYWVEQTDRYMRGQPHEGLRLEGVREWMRRDPGEDE